MSTPATDIDGKRLTYKQTQILDAIRKGAPDGGFIDLDQLLDSLSYETSKSSMQFSLRALIRRGFIAKKGRETRRAQGRQTYALTPAGYASYQSGSGDFVVNEGGALPLEPMPPLDVPEPDLEPQSLDQLLKALESD